MALLGSMVVSTSASLVGAFMPGYWSYLALRLPEKDTQIRFIRKRQGMKWKYDICISTPQTKKIMMMMMTIMTMMMMMMMMMMMNMTRFLTAVGAVGLFNESFTLTVEVMGAKEVGREDDDDDDDDDDGKDEDVEEDHHDNASVMFTEIISDRSLASVGDIQELDGQRGSDSVCGEEGLYDISCFFVKKQT